LNNEPLTPQTSPSLLLRIRDSADSHSWQTFEEVYRPVILAWCRMKGAAPADSEDVAQEVMASVARAIKSFEYRPERGRFRAWLGTITANELKSQVARRKRRPAIALPSGSFAAPPADPDSDWVAIYASRIFDAACRRVRDQFEPATWHCFESTWIARKPAAEVAAALAIPVHSVYVNKSRVLKRLEAEVLMLADEFLPIESVPGDG
jgi:RNA polymerase sigma-70 factor (ECF subfamily)